MPGLQWETLEVGGGGRREEIWGALVQWCGLGEDLGLQYEILVQQYEVMGWLWGCRRTFGGEFGAAVDFGASGRGLGLQ